MAIERVVDSSAIIALIQQEAGADVVAARVGGAAISAVNVTEVCDAMVRNELTSDYGLKYLARLKVEIVPTDANEAVAAGALYTNTRVAGLSLADRHCLALAKRLGVPALTGDRQWQKVAQAIGVEVELFR